MLPKLWVSSRNSMARIFNTQVLNHSLIRTARKNIGSIPRNCCLGWRFITSKLNCPFLSTFIGAKKGVPKTFTSINGNNVILPAIDLKN